MRSFSTFAKNRSRTHKQRVASRAKKTNRRLLIQSLENRHLLAGDVELVGDLGNGIAGTDSRQGDGYVLFSEESVYSRFSANPPAYNPVADHFIAVVQENGQWYYDDNYALRAFQPQESDLLVAGIDFTADTITAFIGQDDEYGGIPLGYDSGDLVFTANVWNGYTNYGEFGISGTQFTRNPDYLVGPALSVGAINYGVAGTDYRQGNGHILYSEESVYDRFAPFGPTYYGSADHFIAVVYQNGQWHYDDNSTLRTFEPDVNDVLIAEVDFTNDAVVDLASSRSEYEGIVAGYIEGDLTFTANQWNGGYNAGEFSISGTSFVPWRGVLAESQMVQIQEDEVYTVSWLDLGITQEDPSADVYIELDSLPSTGSLSLNGAGLSVGSTVSKWSVDRGMLQYTPALDDAGVGIDTFSYSAMTNPSTNRASGQLSIEVLAQAPRGTWELEVFNEFGQSVSNASVGDRVRVDIVGVGPRGSGFKGGWVDIAYNENVLQPVDEVVYDFAFIQLSGNEWVADGRVRDVGGYSSNSVGSSGTVASVFFEIIGGGDADLRPLPPSDEQNDLYLSYDVTPTLPGQVDYTPNEFTALGAPLALAPSNGNDIIVQPTEGAGDAMGPIWQPAVTHSPQSPPSQASAGIEYRPWEFVVFRDYIDMSDYDTSPDIFTEPNRVFKTTPTLVNSSGLEFVVNSGVYDVAYFAVDQVDLPPGESAISVYPYLRMTGLETNTFYFANYPGFISREEGTQEKEVFFGPLDSLGYQEFVLGAYVDNLESLQNGELDVQIVYEDSSGEYADDTGTRYSATLDNAVVSVGTQTRTITLEDAEEPIMFDALQDAVESNPTTDGFFSLTLQNTMPVIPAGLPLDDADTTWYSKSNYFEEDLRIIIEVPASGAQVATGFAEPLVDFTLTAELRGRKEGTSADSEWDAGEAIAASKAVPLELTPVNLNKPGFKHWVVSDTDLDDWITVSGGPANGLWDQLDFTVIPVDDAILEDEESFAIYAEARVPLPLDTSGISGRRELTEYIHLDDATIKITDEPDDGVDENTPTGDGQIEVDGLCGCACTACSSGVPVDMMSGSVSFQATSPAADGGPAAFGPVYTSRGARSTEQTVRFAMPYEEITPSADSAVSSIALQLKVDTGVDTSPSGNGTGITNLVTTDPLSLVPPPNQRDLTGEDSIAVRLPVTFPDSASTGAYKISAEGIASGDGDATGVWSAEAPILLNNTENDYDLAPGWVFPFEEKLVVGTINGGQSTEEADQGAAYFRADQSASYFVKDGYGFETPPETYDELDEGIDGVYRVYHIDDSVSEFELDVAGTSQNTYRISSFQDASGNVTEYSYANNRIAEITDPFGRKVSFQWDDNPGTPNLRITDWHGRVAEYTYLPDSVQGVGFGEVLVEHLDGNDVAMREEFEYAEGQIVRHTITDPSGGNEQETTVSYRSYGPAGSINRVDGLLHPSGERFVLESIGIDDALPATANGWIQDNDWSSNVLIGDSSTEQKQNLITSFIADAWNEGEGFLDDTSTNIAARKYASSIPRSALEDFENYASYSVKGEDIDGSDLSLRHYEFVLDRRGRVNAIQDPEGNVTHYERITEGTGILTADRGQVSQIKGPDPDRTATSNGILERPVTKFEYGDDSPYASRTILPALPDQTQPYTQQASGFKGGVPSRTVDELGNVTFLEQDSYGNPTEIYRRYDFSAPDPFEWQNSVDRYNVTADDDEVVTALDALRIINELNTPVYSNGSGAFLSATRPASATDYFDVSGDGYVSAVDALQVINELNAMDVDSRGSGEIAESTELVYVGTQRYADLVQALINQDATGMSITSEFAASNLIGAEITKTGRDEDADLVTLYTYHLNSATQAHHGQLKAIYQTNMVSGLPDFTTGTVAKTSFEYDSNGFLNATIDPLVRRTDYVNDDLGRPVQILLPTQGNVEIDDAYVSLGRTTINLEYDSFGNLFQEEVVASTFYSEEQSGDAEGVFLPRVETQKRLTSYLYDTSNRLIVSVASSPDQDIDRSVESSVVVDPSDPSLSSLSVPDSRPVTQYYYDTLGQLQKVEVKLFDSTSGSPEFATTQFDYDRLGRLVRTEAPAISTAVISGSNVSILDQSPDTNYTYYAAGNLLTTTDPEGLTATFEYDLWGRPTSEAWTNGSEALKTTSYLYETTTWASNEDLLFSSNVGWQVMATTLDQSIDPSTGQPRNTILQASKSLFDRDGRLNVSQQLLEEAGVPNGVFDDADIASTQTYRYYADGNLASYDDPGNNRTTYGYDYLGRNDQIVEPPAPTSPISVQTSTTSLTYNLAGELEAMTDPTSVKTEFTYDALGNLDGKSTSSSFGTVLLREDFDYDGFSQPFRHTINPDFLDEPGTHAEAVDVASFETSMSYYDRLGRTVAEQGGFTSLTTLGYDLAGRLTTLIDPVGNETTWTHDNSGYAVTESITVDGGTATRSYYRDTVGNVRFTMDRNGRAIVSSYDGYHQPASERWYTPSAAGTGFSLGGSQGGIDFEYDGAGRLLAVGDGGISGQTESHQYEMVYDAGGRLTEELQSFERTVGSTLNVGWSREYNKIGQVTDVAAYTGASTLETALSGQADHRDVITYDDQNRLGSITRYVGVNSTSETPDSSGAQHVVIYHDAADRLSEINRYDGPSASAGSTVGWSTELTYDGIGRINTIEHSRGSQFTKYTTQWGADGQIGLTISQVSHTSAISSPLYTGAERSFQYDARGQVVQDLSEQPGNTALSKAYSTDAAGNRDGYDEATGVYSYSDPSADFIIESDNRLAQDDTWIYDYDLEGNLVEKTSRAASSGLYEQWSYEWDHRNRLITTTLRTGTSAGSITTFVRSVENVYDGLNRWIGRIESAPGTASNETFVYDGNQVSLQYGGNTLETRYLWSEGVDQLLAEQDAQTDEITWTLGDHLGSVRDRVLANGVLKQHVDYDSFGNIEDSTAIGLAPSAAATDAVFGYTGRALDEDTGLQNNHHRWYDAESGRWISKDPSGLGPDSNPYRYTRNQPTMLTDPSGLEPPQLSPEQVDDLINNQTPLIQPNSPYGGIQLGAHGNGLPAGAYGPSKETRYLLIGFEYGDPIRNLGPGAGRAYNETFCDDSLTLSGDITNWPKAISELKKLGKYDVVIVVGHGGPRSTGTISEADLRLKFDVHKNRLPDSGERQFLSELKNHMQGQREIWLRTCHSGSESLLLNIANITKGHVYGATGTWFIIGWGTRKVAHGNEHGATQSSQEDDGMLPWPLD